MMIFKIKIFRLLLLLLSAFCIAIPVEAKAKIKIVAGTEMIADISKDLLADHDIKILTLVPAASCPGHHDMLAADIAFINQADILLLHEWQASQPAISNAFSCTDKPVNPRYIKGQNSWLVPENQICGSQEIAAILSSQYPEFENTINKRLATRIKNIKEIASQLKEELKPYANYPVMCSQMQQEFVEWTGLTVIETYGRAEDVSPNELMHLASFAKKNNAVVVIDNLQSGAEAGLPLAEEVGAKHLVFSNFPNFTPEVNTYTDLLNYNCSALIRALQSTN